MEKSEWLHAQWTSKKWWDKIAMKNTFRLFLYLKSLPVTLLNYLCQHISFPLAPSPSWIGKGLASFWDAIRAHISYRQSPTLYSLSNEPVVIRLWTHFCGHFMDWIFFNSPIINIHCVFKISEHLRLPGAEESCRIPQNSCLYICN